ncbi:UNVERIFIED_CONTAM: Dynein regulatory complex subunit 3 [Siphonaria sp. JEL0065]|nr:Dynein regulatory complex subunit 3 [Siphonaria sp. JEL0065]
MNTIEPAVVDEEILKKATNDQANPEIAEIARREGIDPKETLSLRLDYKNILKIDNLWAFENLTKLQLDNNIIERIENISFLKNLQWLDLSFNNITQIEGLEKLTKLTDLTLFNNRISKLENMDDLVSLNVLSIGNNSLTALENLAYLTRFENLRVLNCAGNALCKNSNYRHYVLAHIRGLKYLDYRLVDEESIAAAREKYIDDLIALEEEEKIAIQKKEEARKRQELNNLHLAAHIEGIDTLYDDMFNSDPDYQKLMPINPDRTMDLMEEYRAKFEVVVNEMRHFALKKRAEMDDELKQFNECLAGTKKETDGECIKMLNTYSHFKKKLLRVLQTSRDTKEIDDSIKTLKEDTLKLSDDLMAIEMQVVEQYEDVIKEFERNFTEQCSALNEYGQSSFARMRELENEYQERFSESILMTFERFSKGDLEEIDDELRDILSDKDALVNTVNGSHDFRLGKFDHQEDLLVSGVGQELETLTKKLHDLEIQRDRDRVCEIFTFIDKCNTEIELAEENAY